MNIESITSQLVLSAAGTPALEAYVVCSDGIEGRALVPITIPSDGEHDIDISRTTQTATETINSLGAQIQDTLAPALLGIQADDQFRVDETLIEITNLSDNPELSMQATLAISLATARAAAQTRNVPLFQHVNDIAGQPAMSIPLPQLPMLYGDPNTEAGPDFLAYMLVPVGAESYQHALHMATGVYAELKSILTKREVTNQVTPHSGFTVPFSTNTEALDLLVKASQAAGYAPGRDIAFAINVTASTLFDVASYTLASENRTLDDDQMIGYFKEIIEQYPIVAIEDGLAHDAWGSWALMTETLLPTHIIGDHIINMNSDRLDKAITIEAANTIRIKPYTIGTLTETIRLSKTALDAGWNTLVACPEIETEDTTVVHLAIGTGAQYIQAGSIFGGEYSAKHNELVRIDSNREDLTMARSPGISA